jgi:aminoglycoside phosphotransferase (APT) family kinase protein
VLLFCAFILPYMSQACGKLKISLSLVTDLITAQFPQWAHLPIKPVEPSGLDNRTFRLGKEMSIRLPSAKAYAPQAQKEQRWLPLLAPYLTCPIPKALAIGQPSINYPWNWAFIEKIKG